MSSASNGNLTLVLNNISMQLDFYLGLLIFIFGSVGNILNIFVLSQRFLRSNSCALLFLHSSFANLLAIIFGLIPRILSSWTIDLINTIGWLCKWRTFILYVSRSIAIWYIMLATIDRWLLSCANIPFRQMNSLKNVQKQMLVVFLLSSLLYIEVFYCYEANLRKAPQSCYGKTELCRLIADLFFILILIMFPLLLMIIFGLMTISNLRQAQCRLQPICMHYIHGKNFRIQKRWKQTDHHLRTMLFVQVILLLLFNIPLVIVKLYSTLTMNYLISSQQKALNGLAYTVTFVMNFAANGLSFYIYTLFGGSMFRRELVHLVKKVRRKLICQRS